MKIKMKVGQRVIAFKRTGTIKKINDDKITIKYDDGGIGHVIAKYVKPIVGLITEGRNVSVVRSEYGISNKSRN